MDYKRIEASNNILTEMKSVLESVSKLQHEFEGEENCNMDKIHIMLDKMEYESNKAYALMKEFHNLISELRIE